MTALILFIMHIVTIYFYSIPWAPNQWRPPFLLFLPNDDFCTAPCCYIFQ